MNSPSPDVYRTDSNMFYVSAAANTLPQALRLLANCLEEEYPWANVVDLGYLIDEQTWNYTVQALIEEHRP